MRGFLLRQFDKLVVRVLHHRQMESLFLREHFRKRFSIEVGLYSFGCFDPWRVARNTRVGRYCSISRTTFLINANHPTTTISSHPYLYDPSFGVITESGLNPDPLVIEDDVWLGHYSIVTPGCTFIGRGSVIGAGAVVTHNVPPYSIVAGVPARVIRKRFSDDVIARIEASRWWELDKQTLKQKAIDDAQFIFEPSN